MPSGYLYVLQNRSFGEYVVKIGLTTREPDVRAKEIYSGATGVPEPFEVAFACIVSDCKMAEERVHSRLAVYRINNRREFFQISPKIAREIVFDTCHAINVESGCKEVPSIFIDKNVAEIFHRESFSDFERDDGGDGPSWEIPLNLLTESPIGTSQLTNIQLDRVRILSAIFAEVYPDEVEQWQRTFSRDNDPEREILIWEHIAKAFLKIDQVRYFDYREKREAFSLLLARSAAPTNDVITKTKCNHFTQKAAREILAGYELPPRPVQVRFVKKESRTVVMPTPMSTAIRGIFAKK